MMEKVSSMQLVNHRMPVFFYIDPEFACDPWMRDVDDITLHYTFFKSKHQNIGSKI